MDLYLGDSIYNDSVVTDEHVTELIEANGKGVFFTIVGTTTYNDTLAAYNDGKVVIAVKYDDVETEHATFYPLTTFDPDPDEGDAFTFARDIDNTFEYYNLHIRGGWSSRIYKNIITVDSQLDPTSHNPVENMAIAVELTAINNKITGDLNDIFLALASKGVTVPAGAGLDDVAGLIEDVPTGGGGVTPDPAEYTTYLYYENTYSYTKIRCSDVRFMTDYKVCSDDIVEHTIYFANTLNASDLSPVNDVIDSIYLMLTGENAKPSGSRQGRKVCLAYGPDRWNTSQDPSNYHLRFAATNWQNGSYYYGAAGCVNVGDSIPAGTTIVVRTGRDWIEVNGNRSNFASPELIVDFETNQFRIIDIYPGGAPLGTIVYEIKIKDKDGNLKYRFVPCVKTSNNGRGYYEVVTGQFAYNGDWAQQSEQPTPGPFMPV